MKKRRNKGAVKAKRRDEQETQGRVERLKTGEMGAPDPMPDGSVRVAQQDAISRMKNEGKLTPTQEHAALEIQRVYIERCSAVFAKTQNLDRVDSSSGNGVEHNAEAHRRFIEFGEWSRARERDTGFNVMSLILDIFGQGYSLTECDKVIGRRRHTARGEILGALTHYAVCAGWERGIDMGRVKH